MVEEVVVEEKQSVAIKWEEKIKKTLKYKTSDGNLYDSKERANSRQKYLDQKAKIVKLDIGDSLFGPDWGELWFFNTFEEMDLIVRNEYDAYVSIGGHFSLKRIMMLFCCLKRQKKFQSVLASTRFFLEGL